MATDETAQRVEEYAVEFDAQCKPIVMKHNKQMQRLQDEILAGIQRAAWRLIGRGFVFGAVFGFILGLFANLCFGVMLGWGTG